MAFILKWEKGGKPMMFSSASCYEFTQQKQKLIKAGVEFKEELTGVEKKSAEHRKEQEKWGKLNRRRFGNLGKSAIRGFLYTCNQVGDLDKERKNARSKKYYQEKVKEANGTN